MDIENLKLDYIPSSYQKKIFDFILHGNGNAVISAKAGSGKTKTAVESMKLINPKYKVMFVAFNKSIAEELSNKLKGYKNVDVKTNHSIGFAMLKHNIEGEIELDEYKYRKHLKGHIMELSDNGCERMTKAEYNTYIDNISSLIDFARYNLAQTCEDVKKLAIKYDIPIASDECEVVIKMLEWGKTMLNCIDYTDMMWLPVECSMSARGFQKDYIFFDEAQDASCMSVQLLLKCFKRGTRFIACADRKQMINTFSGASEDAFDYMKNYPKTTLFDLPICYRCPRRVIEMAQTIVPDIQMKEGAVDGKIIGNCSTSILKSGDMVLCRSKAPLVVVYTKLLKRGVPCYIKGQDFGLHLKGVLESIESDSLNLSLKDDGVFIRLYDNMFQQRNILMENNGLDYQDATLSSYIINMFDMIKTLEVLSGCLTTKTQLINHIDEMFNKEQEGVILSTIHKAKGLEADNVYILCHSSMPSKLAKKDWEKECEENLIYVAYTRARKTLGFISENEIKPFGISRGVDAILNEMALIETLVCRVLNKTPMVEKEAIDVARFNLKNTVTEIVNLHQEDNFIEIKADEDDSNTDLLKELDDLLV